jgi:hypothetical protein
MALRHLQNRVAQNRVAQMQEMPAAVRFAPPLKVSRRKVSLRHCATLCI